MARSLDKVQKKISKKRGGKPNALHENSRDAQRLRTAGAREDKLAKIWKAATRANHAYVDRIEWFRSAIEGSTGPLMEDELLALTASYVERNDEDLAGLKAQRRQGRPPSNQEGQLGQDIDAEKNEFRGGFWAPDLRDEEGRLKLERWSGDWAGLNSLKFVRVKQGGTFKTSSFPPKGLS